MSLQKSCYQIEQPSVPSLSPEFQTPLFLKIFCEGLEKKGLTKIPPGLQGITAVFNFFIQAIQEKLEREFDIRPRYVKQARDILIEALASRGVSWLPLEESEDIVNLLMPHRAENQIQSLHYLLLAEGLLAKDAFLTDRYDWIEGIRFAYERLSDHLIVQFLLSTHLQEMSVKSFSSVPQLAALVTDEAACYRHSGLIEALSIQLPELKGLELVQIFPNIADYLPVRQAFLESLLWRKLQTIGEPAKEYINQYVIKHQDTLEQFLNVLLTVAVNPDHPFNADFLHKHLMRFEMAERDEWWSVFLHEQYDTQNAVDRLIDWAWSPEDKSHIADESVRLCGVALAWFLTTSNRFVRDRATKALVNLFTERIPVLCQLLSDFVEVNDLYVLERLMAVSYGCAMRSRNDQHNAMLAQKVYECIFANDNPPPNILLRDYARGVIESALYKQCELQVDTNRVRPLYKSLWPTYVPEKEELQKLNDQSRGMADRDVSLRTLYSSIMGDGFGDFGIYIIGGAFPWFSRRYGQPRDLSHKEIFEEFLDSLTIEQKAAWDQYQHAKQENLEIVIRYINDLSSEEREELANTLGMEQDFEEPDREVIQEELVFVELLDRQQREIYEGKVAPYFENPAVFSNEFLFDLGLAKRWIFQKTLDFGWTIERFGEFDRNVNRYSFYGRGTRKPERIGKKYQWLAYHEFLARVSDNFEFKGDYWSDKKEAYNGPWQISSIRDIDPSCLLRKTPQDISWQSHRTSWWAKLRYEDWEVEPDEVTWLKGTGDLPDVTALIAPVNQKDGSAWLTLEANYRWTQASPVWDDSYNIPRKDIVYWLQSYIVKKSDIEGLFDWAIKENFYGKSLPDSHPLTQVFLGEFFWSPAFAYHNIPYYHHDGWIGGEVGDFFPKKVLVSTDQYLQENSGYDCSIDEGIHIYLPCQWIADQMKLSWNGVEGHFFDARGKLIAFDPSTRTPGPGALLINRDAFRSFLDENGYDVLWIITGNKQFVGGNHRSSKGRLEISGAYRVQGNKVVGALVSNFQSWQ